ncbi:MAG TPA: restriction endonuclease subunit M [Acholeplasmataceae bacterium]|nr:restriction endonuclease subunit M [Acholeplasmataceae bacterium]
MHTINDLCLTHDEDVNSLEKENFEIDSELLKLLLLDMTTKSNISWCTDNYSKHGKEYRFNKTIEVELITGKKRNIIQPRAKKNNDEKKKRTKQKAEVFTPAWVCNHQINLIDEIWFGKKNIFNKEDENTWITNNDKIKFECRSWQEYVLDIRLEITCGESPYIVSRYDTVTGETIKPINRIGLLDRKIRVINENVANKNEWYTWVKKAYQSVYGYEWQGDSLLITRENLLYSFIDYYIDKFNEKPSIDMLKEIAEIIVWNFWQMDGVKGVVPLSCNNDKFLQLDLFGNTVNTKCNGCETQNIWKHNGIYCLIKDWQKNKIMRFIDLLPRGY